MRIIYNNNNNTLKFDWGRCIHAMISTCEEILISSSCSYYFYLARSPEFMRSIFKPHSHTTNINNASSIRINKLFEDLPKIKAKKKREKLLEEGGHFHNKGGD